MLLRDNKRVVRRASAKTQSIQELGEFAQRPDRHPGYADLHAGTGSGVKHPRRDDRDEPGLNLDKGDLRVAATLDAL